MLLQLREIIELNINLFFFFNNQNLASFTRIQPNHIVHFGTVKIYILITSALRERFTYFLKCSFFLKPKIHLVLDSLPVKTII